MIVVLVTVSCGPGLINFSPLSFQRVKELEEEARAKSPGLRGKVDPTLVAEQFLERPRMEQRFFGFRFDSLYADGLYGFPDSLILVHSTVCQ